MSCNHSLEKAQSSQHAVLGTRTSTCGSLQQEPYHIQYKKINLQVIRALDLLFDSIKLLEENNAKKNLQNTGMGKYFLESWEDPRTMDSKSKNRKVSLHEAKKLLTDILVSITSSSNNTALSDIKIHALKFFLSVFMLA